MDGDRNNIIGEDIPKYVVNEITRRQKIHYSGYINGDNPHNSSQRGPEELLYSTKNAWIKCASSVNIVDKKILENPRFQNIKDSLTGSTLSKQNSFLGILKNLQSTPNNQNNLTSTFSNHNIGSNPLYGHNPPPGIISFSIDSVNRGSIRKGTLVLKAFNKDQFDLLEFLYLRIGFSVMVEWGWNFKNEDLITIVDREWWDERQEGYTSLQMLDKIEEKRQEFGANYDGFFGKVSNFDWSFGADGTYDIIVSLITMGDVVESLKISIPPKTINTKITPRSDNSEFVDLAVGGQSLGVFKADSNLVRGSKYLKLSDILLKTIYEKKFLTHSEYYDLKNSSGLVNDTPIANTYNYFLTFRELMRLIQDYIIPSVGDSNNSEKQIKFSEDLWDEGMHIIPIYPNQISFDPRVCLFEFYDTLNYNNISGIGVYPLGMSYTSLTGINKEVSFVIKDENTGLRYGNLGSLYINYDFVSKCIINNSDQKGDTNLFQFLSSLCSGINRALGNINKIEPILVKDKIISFIDQTPIPEVSKLSSKIGFEVNDSPENVINIWGYDISNQTSNFVKDFKFKTKMTPEIAAQISIGVTANQNYTSYIDGTSFQKWNNGLQDRFNKGMYNANDYDIGLPASTNEFTLSPEERWQTYYRLRAEIKKSPKVNVYYIPGDTKAYIYSESSIPKNTAVTVTQGYQFVYKGVTYTGGESAINKILYKDLGIQEIKDSIENYKDNNYNFWLYDAFGGEPPMSNIDIIRAMNPEDKIPEYTSSGFNKEHIDKLSDISTLKNQNNSDKLGH